MRATSNTLDAQERSADEGTTLRYPGRLATVNPGFELSWYPGLAWVPRPTRTTLYFRQPVYLGLGT